MKVDFLLEYKDWNTFKSKLIWCKDNECQNCQVVLREPPRDGRGQHWTGLGFMRVFDGSFLEFDIENIETSMEYDLVIKYEPQVYISVTNLIILFT